MPASRLTSLDASFLEAESATAHMHVGWAALFSPPAEAPPPRFEELREHINSRLGRAPRYRQKLASVPFGLTDPVWVDDSDFDIDRHVRHASGAQWSDTVDAAMSSPLVHGRPLWEVWIADGLDDGRTGLVGKVHHCMVDGLAAVELAALLLDPTPEPLESEPDSWEARQAPDGISLLLGGVVERLRKAAELGRLPVTIAQHPPRLFGLAGKGLQTVRAVSRSLEASTPNSGFNGPSSAGRHLASAQRPLADLKRIKARFETSINDVVLAVAAGGLRGFFEQQNLPPVKLKAMVPVSVRRDGTGGGLGNQISFIYVDLPCDEPDPVRRLRGLAMAMGTRKERGEPQGADNMLSALSYAPRPIQHAITRMVASPRTFNLVVSNIPGPQQPLYMLGCEIAEVFPVVPLSDQHAVSIGMTTINDRAYFGVYADTQSLPNANLLSTAINDSIEELFALS
jgi:diacylglycerol O-acyltransferase / wax synthase